MSQRRTQGSQLYGRSYHQTTQPINSQPHQNQHRQNQNHRHQPQHQQPPNNNRSSSNNSNSNVPSLKTFTFSKPVPVSSGSSLYSNIGSGGIHFDLKKQTNNGNPKSKEWRDQTVVNKSDTSSSSKSQKDIKDFDEKLAKRAERFGTGTNKKKDLYKPEHGSLNSASNSAANQSDFIGFGSLFDQDQEQDEDLDDFKIHKKYNDRDPLDLVYDLPSPIWVDGDSRRRGYSCDLTQMFNQEVQDYVDYISPTPSEHSIRHLTIERLRFVVAKLWPDATVHVFGSFSTKLYLPTSDVDVVIMGKNIRAPGSLFELSVALRDHKYVSKIEVIAKARVPIIKYMDALTTFPVDISINMGSGLQAAEIVTHFLNEPNGVGQAIRGLMYLLKQFLLARHLNEPFSGGCGSYALLILVSSFVKLHPLLQIGALNPSENLGTLFLEFLELYGRHFNFQEVGIMCSLKTGPEYFLKRDMRYTPGRKIGFLTVLDPQDESNDVGAGAFNFYTIKQEFFRASQRLMCILGAGQKRNLELDRKSKSQSRHAKKRKSERDQLPPPPLSILSAILTVRQGLFTYRCGMDELWQKVSAGKVQTGVEESVWQEVCLGLKRHEEERVVAVKRKREDGEISDESVENLVVGVEEEEEEGAVVNQQQTAQVSIPVEEEGPQKKKVHLVESYEDDSNEFVPLHKREVSDWKVWEKEYMQTLREAKEELGYSGSDVSMDMSSGEEEGQIVVATAKTTRHDGGEDEEEEERKGDFKNPLKKK
ncbi:UNVERIFIED_CONTAM: hypothetical protein HDU68_010796 [Siphonaria sp. JEL0065]|nr:hypothetical protein HDU68_010796 [Siphonaria sp. JEL0065]